MIDQAADFTIIFNPSMNNPVAGKALFENPPLG